MSEIFIDSASSPEDGYVDVKFYMQKDGGLLNRMIQQYPTTVTLKTSDIKEVLLEGFEDYWVEYIDNMTHEDMARAWRFHAPGSYPFFDSDHDELHAYFMSKWDEFGGWNPTLSKKIGWEVGNE